MSGPDDALPKPVTTFLAQHAEAVLWRPGEVLDAGERPRVAVVLPDVLALRQAPGGGLGPGLAGVRTGVLGVFVASHRGALLLQPRPEWPPLAAVRSRAAAGGYWLILRFAPGTVVEVAAVLEELGRQLVWGGPWAAPREGGTLDLDVRLINPIGFTATATEPVVEAAALDLRQDVGPVLIDALRSAAGVRVGAWPAAVTAAVPAFALAGVPVVAEAAVAAAAPATVPAAVRDLLAAPVDLTDPLAREEHSLLLRRAAFDALAGVRQPSVSILLATKRADMLPHALAQVARQRGVDELELVLAPHGFEVDPAVVREAVGPHVAVQVLPHPDDAVFGDVLHAAATAAGGELVLKMDDDDWYAPDVVADLLRARAYSGAELVGMPAELHYLTAQDLTVKRGHPVEVYATFVAGGTMLLARSTLAEVGGWRAVRRFVDAQLLESIAAAGGVVYRTHGLGYVLRRNPTGHTWQVDLDYLLDPARTVATWPGFRPSRLMELTSPD